MVATVYCRCLLARRLRIRSPPCSKRCKHTRFRAEVHWLVNDEGPPFNVGPGPPIWQPQFSKNEPQAAISSMVATREPSSYLFTADVGLAIAILYSSATLLCFVH